MYVLTLNNYPSEASVMVARQLKIVSQSDAFIFDFLRKRQCLILPDRLHTYLGLNSNGSPY